MYMHSRRKCVCLASLISFVMIHCVSYQWHNPLTCCSSFCYPLPFFLVRQKAKDLVAFLQDDHRLRDARKNARKTRDKYVGISSSENSDKYSKSNPNQNQKFQIHVEHNQVHYLHIILIVQYRLVLVVWDCQTFIIDCSGRGLTSFRGN